jgi:hypothetical protein
MEHTLAGLAFCAVMRNIGRIVGGETELCTTSLSSSLDSRCSLERPLKDSPSHDPK